MTNYKSEFLNIMEERGFIAQGSNMEGLDEKLSEGVQCAYVGYDPTGTSLHIGHLYTIMMLAWFQKSGHKPISLMGGGTALIPDPTLKDKTRPLLTPDEIDKNIAGIKTVFSQFLAYGEGKTDAVMVNNYDWLKKLDYIDFLRDIGIHFSVNRMLSFESVKMRLDRELPMSFIEFNYMILQGYDFLELNQTYGTILQMGGNDQWGNIINGVELTRKKARQEVFALTAPLLLTADGKKMGKTEGGAILLNEEDTSPYEYYQYWRNVGDADVEKLLKVFTFLPMDEIGKLAALKGQEINEAKKVLAFEATKLLHGEKAATEASETASKTFEQGSVGDDLPSITIDQATLDSGFPILTALNQAGLVSSNGEARRLIKQGGAKVNDNKVEADDFALTSSDMQAEGYIKLSAGKKKHALIKIG